MEYSDFKALLISVSHGIARIVLQYQGADLATSEIQHREIGKVWRVLDSDPEVRVVLITGKGEKEFYLSGNPETLSNREFNVSWSFTAWMEREVQQIVQEMVNFSKPIVAAINGAASGAGLTVVLLSDISIMAEDAYLLDPHIMLGGSTGDGAGALLPLFTGIAKAKLYLLTSDALDAKEADRIGIIGRSVPRSELMNIAEDYARRLARSPEIALRFSKRGINQWLRHASVISGDYSYALEALGAYSGESKGGPYTDWPPRKIP
jgi:enoyl-CoA hydratase